MRLSTILDQIDRQMTLWAKELELEHSEYPVFFDLRKLSVAVQRDNELFYLSEIGSAENWLGYNLITYFSLHLYFTRNKRPIPNFIILDQPSQVYYPPEQFPSSNGSVDQLESKDQKSVNRFYQLFFDVVKLMDPDLQIIVTDHAKLDSEEFVNSIVEEWRGGLKLIPAEWE